LLLAFVGPWLYVVEVKAQNGAPSWQFCPNQPGLAQGGIGINAHGTVAEFFDPAGSGAKLYKINVQPLSLSGP